MMENVDVSEKSHRNKIDVDQNVKHSRKTKKNKKTLQLVWRKVSFKGPRLCKNNT